MRKTYSPQTLTKIVNAIDKHRVEKRSFIIPLLSDHYSIPIQNLCRKILTGLHLSFSDKTPFFKLCGDCVILNNVF